MNELKQIILALIDVVETADSVTSPDSKKGTRVSFGEWVDIAKTGGRAIPAFAGWKQAGEKLRTLTPAEKAELVTFVRTELDLRDDVAEAVTENALDVIGSLFLMITAIKNGKKA